MYIYFLSMRNFVRFLITLIFISYYIYIYYTHTYFATHCCHNPVSIKRAFHVLTEDSNTASAKCRENPARSRRIRKLALIPEIRLLSSTGRERDRTRGPEGRGQMRPRDGGRRRRRETNRIPGPIRDLFMRRRAY